MFAVSTQRIPSPVDKVLDGKVILLPVPKLLPFFSQLKTGDKPPALEDALNVTATLLHTLLEDVLIETVGVTGEPIVKFNVTKLSQPAAFTNFIVSVLLLAV